MDLAQVSVFHDINCFDGLLFSSPVQSTGKPVQSTGRAIAHPPAVAAA